jgi:hypothetical protein
MNKILIILSFVLLTPLSAFADREDLPATGVEQTVYLGDKMLEQRFGFYDECQTLTQDLLFSRKRYERVCLKSAQTFEKRYSRGVSQIEKGGILCPVSEFDKKGRKAYTGMNFFGYKNKDGTDKRPARPWSLREAKDKKRWYAEPNGTKVVDLPRDEFDQIFTQHEMFNAEMFAIDAGWKECEVDGGGGSGRYTVIRGATELPQRIQSGDSHSVRFSDFVTDQNGIRLSGDFMATAYSWWREKARWKRYKGYPVDPYNNPYDLDDVDKSDDAFMVTPKKTSALDEVFQISRPYIILEDNLQRHIEYAGKSRDVLTFVYSESFHRLARDAFTREFTIDMSEGNVGAFKGAVFEVIEATNSTITYKVIRHFPE